MKAILSGANSKRETKLKVGDVIGYDKTSRSIKCWRTKNGSLVEGLDICNNDKLYSHLPDPGQLYEIVLLVSACTGLSFEVTKAYPTFKLAFTFTAS